MSISELTTMVKEFYKSAFYDKYKIGSINSSSLQETTEWEFKVTFKNKNYHLKSFLIGVWIAVIGEAAEFKKF